MKHCVPENSELELDLRALKSLKLSHFLLVREIAQHGSLARAAETMAQTQSATTKNLQSLEAGLGVLLFERKGRGVEITQAGMAFLHHSRKILSEFRYATEHLSALTSGTAGRISIGTLIAATPRLLPETLLRYQKDNPDVIISIREGTNEILYPALLVGELDLIVGRLSIYRGRDGVSQKQLYEESVKIVCAASHPIADKQSLALRDLADCNWILPPPETTLRRELDRVFHDNNMPIPHRRYESVALLTNLALFAEGDFIGALPEQVYLAYRAMFNLRALPINIEPILGPVGYSFRKDEDPTPTARGFIQYLENAAVGLGI